MELKLFIFFLLNSFLVILLEFMVMLVLRLRSRLLILLVFLICVVFFIGLLSDCNMVVSLFRLLFVIIFLIEFM